MPFCHQCGEEIRLSTERCPACDRLVGMSSVGLAKARQARPGTRRALVVAVLACGALVLAVAAARLLRPSDPITNERLVEAARAAAVSTVRVAASATADVGGVVVRSLSGVLLVATEAAAGAPGRVVEVSSRETHARGVVLLQGRGGALGGLAVVVVPDGLAGAVPAALVRELAVDEPILALNANATLASAGRVLSFDDDLVLVHDAPLVASSRGYGLWSASGRLAAYASSAAGESTAVAASALASRLLVFETTLPADSAWVDPKLPIPAGASVAVFARGAASAGLALRFGDRGAVVRATVPWAGVAVAEVPEAPATGLQLGRASGRPAGASLAVTLVALAPGAPAR